MHVAARAHRNMRRADVFHGSEIVVVDPDLADAGADRDVLRALLRA